MQIHFLLYNQTVAIYGGHYCVYWLVRLGEYLPQMTVDTQQSFLLEIGNSRRDPLEVN